MSDSKIVSNTENEIVCLKTEKESSNDDNNNNCDETKEINNNNQLNNSEKDDKNGNVDDDVQHEHYESMYKPKISLPLTETKTLEDDEDIIVNLRARIYRYDTTGDEPEFKERGTGTVKILQHKQTKLYRILMRREKTFKICANHYITGSMKLSNHNNSAKVFLYSTLADFYDNETNPETFAIRFPNAENASIFKQAFDDAVEFMIKKESLKKQKSTEENDGDHVNDDKKEKDELAEDLEKIQINSETTNNE